MPDLGKGDWKVNGPLPPSGDIWCTPCVMLWRAEVMAKPQIKMQILAAEAKPGEITEIELPAKLVAWQPKLAVTWGPYVPLQHLLPTGMWICWTHIMGLELRASGVVPVAADQMPSAQGIGMSVPLLGTG